MGTAARPPEKPKPGKYSPPLVRRLVQGGMLLAIANIASALCNYLFQAVIGRMLSIGQFGIVNSMLSISLIASVPANAISWSMTRFVSQRSGHDQKDQIAYLIRQAFQRLLFWFVPLCIVWVLAAPHAARFLRIPGTGPIYASLAIVLATLVRPILQGSLRGLERFGVMAGANIVQAFTRVLLGALLVWAGAEATGALSGNALSLVIAAAIALPFLPLGHKGWRGHGFESSELASFFWPALSIMAALAILSNADMIAAKAALASDRAGLYSAASVFARGSLFFVLPAVSVVFPIISRRQDISRILGVGCFQVTINLCGTLLAPLLIRLLLGRPEPDAVALLPRFLWSISPLTLAMIPIHFGMARANRILSVGLPVIAAGYIAALLRYHSDPVTILNALATASLCAMVFSIGAGTLRSE
jgi:O-antigen/teichoic acid export membrane protein